MPYSIEMLSLSKIGDILREKLGDDVDQYKFPDDFEKAVVDIGFQALVLDGDTRPVEECILIGNILSRFSSQQTSPALSYKKLRLIGTTTLPNYACYGREMTEIDFGNSLSEIGSCAFQSTTSLTNVVLPNTITTLLTGTFTGSALLSLSGPEIRRVSSSQYSNGCFYNCVNLRMVSLPKCEIISGANSSNKGTFSGCSSLEDVTIGSVGIVVNTIGSYEFIGCTSQCIITIYTAGNYVDTLLANVRNGAVNATIIIKAAENTVYGGVSYSAGDTILTSQP